MTSSVRRTTAVVALTVAVASFLWWYGNKHDFFDLRIYLSAMRWWTDGHPLYDYSQPDPVQGRLYFTYPPFAALLLWPFGQLPTGAAIGIFTAATIIAYGVTTWWLAGPLARVRGWSRWLIAGLALPLVFAMEPTRETITFGQINMLLIVLILVDMLFCVPGKSRWAGVGIGLATAIKLFPGIFIVYLLVSRRWRAAITAAAVAAGATLLAAAIAPRASWQFWTEALWATERVGRTDYTGNQSLLGLLSRLTVPGDPPRGVWLALVAVIGGYGLWRASRASDPVVAIALTGLVGALASPITWPHHMYWFVPAIVALVAVASHRPIERVPSTGVRSTPPSLPLRLQASALAVCTYAVSVFGVVSFEHWGSAAPARTDTLIEFIGRNAYVLLALMLIITLPLYTTKVPKGTDLFVLHDLDYRQR